MTDLQKWVALLAFSLALGVSVAFFFNYLLQMGQLR